MYTVSNDYEEKLNSGIIQSKVEFTISGNQGVYGDDNILKGSFSITNQSTDTKDIVLGSVYMAQLTATLRGVSVSRNNWRGRTITPTYKLKISDNTWESVPLGVFVVSEATHSQSGIVIKAYDNMSKFDKPMSMNQSSGYLYDFLALACQACNVTLGQTEQELKALPNGSTVFQFFSKSDVETWRDVISWVAQTCGGFATINRAGQLEIRTYGTNVVKEFEPQDRITGGEFSDYTTHYTGISYVDVEKEQTRYQGLEVDDGITMNLGANPFLQVRTTAQTAVQTLLSVIADIEYTPFKMSILNNPIYDLGDVVEFSGGIAGTSCTCCIMKYEFVHHAKYSMMGYGANPEEASAKSKTDKNISGIMAGQSIANMAFYEYRNVTQIAIANAIERQIAKLKVLSNANTRVDIHININLQTISSSQSDFTKAKVKYIINSEEVALKPQETYIDGYHVMHLMYVLPVMANTTTYFIVRMSVEDGAINIERQGVWLYASGTGIVGDGTWDGTFDLEDEVTSFAEPSIVFGDATESVTVAIDTPSGASISDTVSSFAEPTIVFGDADEDVRITYHNTAFERVTEEGDTRLTEEGDSRMTEEEVT